jgi:hypothetical protein
MVCVEVEAMNPDLTHEIIIHNNDWHLAEEWCNQNIGAFNQEWYKLGIDPMDNLLYEKTPSVWYFRREQDAVAFALRWT